MKPVPAWAEDASAQLYSYRPRTHFAALVLWAITSSLSLLALSGILVGRAVETRGMEAVGSAVVAALWSFLGIRIGIGAIQLLRSDRRLVVLTEAELIDARRASRRSVLLDSIVRIVAAGGTERQPTEVSFETDDKPLAITADLHGWPRLVAEVIHRCPSARVDLDPRLVAHLTALREGRLPRITAEAAPGEVTPQPTSRFRATAVGNLMAGVIIVAPALALSVPVWLSAAIGLAAVACAIVWIRATLGDQQPSLRLAEDGVWVMDATEGEDLVPWSEVFGATAHSGLLTITLRIDTAGRALVAHCTRGDAEAAERVVVEVSRRMDAALE